MEEITYREICPNDYRSIKKLIDEVWNLNQFCDTEKQLDDSLNIYLQWRRGGRSAGERRRPAEHRQAKYRDMGTGQEQCFTAASFDQTNEKAIKRCVENF